MSYPIRMTFYVTETDDGLIHVQNAVMGFLGQHHVHTKADYERWEADGHIKPRDIVLGHAKACDCGLKAGEVRSGR